MPMPGMLFSLFMPFGSTMRVFHRFALDSSLGFAILAGLGAASLWSATNPFVTRVGRGLSRAQLGQNRLTTAEETALLHIRPSAASPSAARESPRMNGGLARETCRGMFGIGQRAFSTFGISARYSFAGCMATHSTGRVRDLLADVRQSPERRQTLLAFALIVVVLIDVAAAPLPFGVSNAGGFEVDHWLKEQKGDFSVIHLPLARGLNGPGLYRAAIHGKKISYGYGTFFPNAWRVAVTPLGNFPNPEAIALLRSWHVRYVLLGQGAYEAGRVDAPGDSWDKVQERLKSTPELRYVRTFDEVMPSAGDKLSDRLTVPWLGVPVIADRTLVYEVLP